MGVLAADVGTVVVIDSVFECLNTGLVAELNNISVIDVNVEASLFGELVESVVKVFSMGDILLKAEDGPLSEVDWLVDDGSEDLGVVKGAVLLTTVVTGVNLWSFQNSSLDSIWLDVDVEVPFLDLLGVGDHSVELLDGSDSLWWLLEEALSDVGHDSLVLSNFGGDSDKGAELWREINVLSLLADLEERLVDGVNLNTVSGLEVVNHVGSGLLISVVEDVVLRVHVPLDLMDLVGSVRTVLGHDDGSLELSVDESGIVSLASISDQSQAVVNR